MRYQRWAATLSCYLTGDKVRGYAEHPSFKEVKIAPREPESEVVLPSKQATQRYAVEARLKQYKNMQDNTTSKKSIDT